MATRRAMVSKLCTAFCKGQREVRPMAYRQKRRVEGSQNRTFATTIMLMRILIVRVAVIVTLQKVRWPRIIYLTINCRPAADQFSLVRYGGGFWAVELGPLDSIPLPSDMRWRRTQACSLRELLLSLVEREKDVRPYRERRGHVQHIQGSAAGIGCVFQRKPPGGLENFGGKGEHGIDTQSKVTLNRGIRCVHLSAGQLPAEDTQLQSVDQL